MKHGARSDRVVLPRAEAIEAALLEDPGVPDHLRSPAFRPAVRGWAKAEAIEERLFAHVEELTRKWNLSRARGSAGGAGSLARW